MSLKSRFNASKARKSLVPTLMSLTLIGVLAGCDSDGTVITGAPLGTIDSSTADSGDADGSAPDVGGIDGSASDADGTDADGTDGTATDAGGTDADGTGGTTTGSDGAAFFNIGDTGPAGGFVFQVSGDGASGLEAATTAIVTAWGCDGIFVDVTNGTEPSSARVESTGESNADFTIPTGQSVSPLLEMQGCTASGVATGFSGGGFTDWFLPSSDELFQLNNAGSFLQEMLIPGSGVWSSTEQNADNVFVLFPGIDVVNTGPLIGANPKTPDTGGTTFVVPVRAF